MKNVLRASLLALPLLPGCSLFQRVASLGLERPNLTFESWSASRKSKLRFASDNVHPVNYVNYVAFSSPAFKAAAAR
jgi:hypothetical protein